MKSEEGWPRCAVVNGSSWNTEKRGAEVDVFVGVEHRQRGERLRSSSGIR